jgi:peptidoglycan/xylan/chitin deacetylase (PgdA/CDA1 family)
VLGHRPPVAAILAIAIVVVAVVAAGCAAPEGSGSTPGTAVVPASASASAPSASIPDRPFRPTPAPSPTFASYVVQHGDTLLTLAVRFGTTARSLAYWNRARYPSLDPDSTAYAPDRIEAGWTLAYVPGQVVDPERLPSPAATSPGPRGSPDPFPALPPDGSALAVTHGPRGTDAVALTFDYVGGPGAGAPTAGGAEAVLQWLVTMGVTATVFVAPAAADPADTAGHAVLARIAAAPSLVTSGLLPPQAGPGIAWDADVRAADARLAPLLGRSTAPWFRVSGTLDAGALGAIGRAGWRWLVGTDVDPGDGIGPADGGPIAADIVARVISRSTGGSIIRLTLGGTHTLEALPAILDGLAANGLRVVSLGELLGAAAP